MVFRLGPGDDVPPSWSPLVEAATACLEGSAAAESSGGEPDAGTAHPQRKDHRPGPSRRFVDGLEELIAALGGPATARQMLEALAAEENQARFEGLRSALRQLFPNAEGGLPTARQLGYALRSYRRGSAGEKAVVATGEVKQGKTWAVGQTPGGCDSAQGDAK